jgi:hypothetical protein
MVGSEKTEIWRIKLGILHRFAGALNVVLSAIIPSAAILALYMVDNLPYRIAVVAAFSGVFASVLAIFTTARPVEIFAATAAYVFRPVMWALMLTDLGLPPCKSFSWAEPLAKAVSASVSPRIPLVAVCSCGKRDGSGGSV